MFIEVKEVIGVLESVQTAISGKRKELDWPIIIATSIVGTIAAVISAVSFIKSLEGMTNIYIGTSIISFTAGLYTGWKSRNYIKNKKRKMIALLRKREKDFFLSIDEFLTGSLEGGPEDAK